MKGQQYIKNKQFIVSLKYLDQSSSPTDSCKENQLHALPTHSLFRQSAIFVTHHQEVYCICIYAAIGKGCAFQLTVCCPSQLGQQSSKKQNTYQFLYIYRIDFSWNVMTHGDLPGGKWRGNWRMEWVASTLHTASKHGVSNVTTADAHTSAVPVVDWTDDLRQFKWTCPFRRKTKSSSWACGITFQLAFTAIFRHD